MDADEQGRIEALLKLLHRHSHEVTCTRGVDFRVISACLNIIDIAHPHEPHTTTMLHCKPDEVFVFPSCLWPATIIQQSDESALNGRIASTRKGRSRAI